VSVHASAERGVLLFDRLVSLALTVVVDRLFRSAQPRLAGSEILRPIEIPDPHLEKLVEQGKCIRHGCEERVALAHRRASKCRIIVARVRYKTVDAEGNADVINTPMHPEMLPSAIAAPSLSAHVIMENVGKGLPLFGWRTASSERV
jgi:hypothetical protein